MNRIDYLRTIGRGELTAGRLIEAAWRRLIEVPHRVAWEMPSNRKRMNDIALERYRDLHRGDRCFVVANGPSLASMDLTVLRQETTIGMNRIYRSTSVSPTYLVVTDVDVQLEQIGAEMRDLHIPKFVNWNGRRYVDGQADVVFLKLTFRPRFSTNLHRGIWGGHSVTYACLQLAYWMGFKEVILIGKDHDYSGLGVPGQALHATGDEANHAFKGYYAPGQKWRIPDYKGEELAYRAARAAFEADRRRVLDATVNGKLGVFQKVKFESLF